MKDYINYMQRCLQLAKNGFGKVAPNPMVGSVIVHNQQIIGEGFHRFCGDKHAEVHAIESVKDKTLLKEATLYVNLEPCSHFGKTPPCANLIVEHQLKKVVIGTRDFSAKVNGKGIQLLKENGIEVAEDILQKESQYLNCRFFTFQIKKRPFVILKWAQTLDGFISSSIISSKDIKNRDFITGEMANRLNQTWRSQESAILVGSNTARMDNPQLNCRLVGSNNPLRITIDKNGLLKKELYLLDGTTPTLIFTEIANKNKKNLEYKTVSFTKNLIPQILDYLHKKEIQSVIIEGGTKTINSFIEQGLWDETRVFIADKTFGKGTKAPKIPLSKQQTSLTIGNDKLLIISK